MSKFSNLPNDLLIDIAKRLKKLEDYTSFGCVSKFLRAIVKHDCFEGLPFRQHTPYMMLSVREGANDDIREVYSLVENESIVASIKVPNFKRKKCLESLGWLLVSDAADCTSCLLDPFSGIEIPLPHQNTFPDYDDVRINAHHHFFYKIVLSSSPNESSDFVLMVIAGGLRELAFWRLGDKSWTKIDERVGAYSDVVHYGGGKFYAFNYPGKIFVFNFSGSDNQIKVDADIVLSFVIDIPEHLTRPVNWRIYMSEVVTGKRIYLLKTINDSLLLLTRPSPLLESVDESYVSTKFQVYDLDVEKGTWKEIYSLGSMAVFLGHNSTTFVDASRFPGVVKPNHIYFTDDNWEYYNGRRRGVCGGYDSGVYNLETGTIEPIYLGEVLLSKISPSFWITPCV